MASGDGSRGQGTLPWNFESHSFLFQKSSGEANDLRLPLSQGHSRGRPYPQRNKNEAHPNRDPFRWVVVAERWRYYFLSGESEKDWFSECDMDGLDRYRGRTDTVTKGLRAKWDTRSLSCPDFLSFPSPPSDFGVSRQISGQIERLASRGLVRRRGDRWSGHSFLHFPTPLLWHRIPRLFRRQGLSQDRVSDISEKIKAPHLDYQETRKKGHNWTRLWSERYAEREKTIHNLERRRKNTR